jgi:hypothetical protein
MQSLCHAQDSHGAHITALSLASSISCSQIAPCKCGPPGPLGTTIGQLQQSPLQQHIIDLPPALSTQVKFRAPMRAPPPYSPLIHPPISTEAPLTLAPCRALVFVLVIVLIIICTNSTSSSGCHSFALSQSHPDSYSRFPAVAATVLLCPMSHMLCIHYKACCKPGPVCTGCHSAPKQAAAPTPRGCCCCCCCCCFCCCCCVHTGFDKDLQAASAVLTTLSLVPMHLPAHSACSIPPPPRAALPSSSSSSSPK